MSTAVSLPWLFQPESDRFARLPSQFDLPTIRHTFWDQAARENQLTRIAALPDDWDGCGAMAVTPEAVSHARILLSELSAANDAPDFISPSSAGTILFEWERPLGSAQLEIGRTTFGFYTSPNVGDPILYGGQIEVLDAKYIRVALATITPKTTGASLAVIDNYLGF